MFASGSLFLYLGNLDGTDIFEEGIFKYVHLSTFFMCHFCFIYFAVKLVAVLCNLNINI